MRVDPVVLGKVVIAVIQILIDMKGTPDQPKVKRHKKYR